MLRQVPELRHYTHRPQTHPNTSGLSGDLLGLRIFAGKVGIEAFIDSLPGIAMNTVIHVVETVLNSKRHKSLIIVFGLILFGQIDETEALKESFSLSCAFDHEKGKLRLNR